MSTDWKLFLKQFLDILAKNLNSQIHSLQHEMAWWYVRLLSCQKYLYLCVCGCGWGCACVRVRERERDCSVCVYVCVCERETPVCMFIVGFMWAFEFVHLSMDLCSRYLKRRHRWSWCPIRQEASQIYTLHQRVWIVQTFFFLLNPVSRKPRTTKELHVCVLAYIILDESVSDPVSRKPLTTKELHVRVLAYTILILCFFGTVRFVDN